MHSNILTLEKRRPSTEDDLLAYVGDIPPLLEGETVVDAQCVSIIGPFRFRFKGHERAKLVFWFVVVVPHEHAGKKLPMYVRMEDAWRGRPISRRAKLHKLAYLATGRHLTKGYRITKTMWLGKIFRCRLKRVTVDSGGDEAMHYTVIDTILEKVAG